MDEYISRKYAIARFTFEKGNYIPEKLVDGYDNVIAIRTIKRVLREIPAADVVPVVRCKECRYYQNAKVNKKGFLICPASGMEVTEDDYCSYGERKEDNT